MYIKELRTTSTVMANMICFSLDRSVWSYQLRQKVTHNACYRTVHTQQVFQGLVITISMSAQTLLWCRHFCHQLVHGAEHLPMELQQWSAVSTQCYFIILNSGQAYMHIGTDNTHWPDCIRAVSNWNSRTSTQLHFFVKLVTLMNRFSSSTRLTCSLHLPDTSSMALNKSLNAESGDPSILQVSLYMWGVRTPGIHNPGLSSTCRLPWACENIHWTSVPAAIVCLWSEWAVLCTWRGWVRTSSLAPPTLECRYVLRLPFHQFFLFSSVRDSSPSFMAKSCCIAGCQAPVQAVIRPAMWLPGIKNLHLATETWEFLHGSPNVRTMAWSGLRGLRCIV